MFPSVHDELTDCCSNTKLATIAVMLVLTSLFISSFTDRHTSANGGTAFVCDTPVSAATREQWSSAWTKLNEKNVV